MGEPTFPSVEAEFLDYVTRFEEVAQGADFTSIDRKMLGEFSWKFRAWLSVRGCGLSYPVGYANAKALLDSFNISGSSGIVQEEDESR